MLSRVVMPALLLLPLLPAPARAQSIDALNRAIAACAQGPTNPLPGLTVEERQALIDGEVVRRVDRQANQPSAAVGMALLKAPRDRLWIGAQDPHANVDPGLTEFIVEEIDRDRMLWYGHLDLPRPLKDRQWVVESGNNHRMARLTGGACWEHLWALVPDGVGRIRDKVEANEPRGITTDHLDNAIVTPDNQGSWFMAPVDERHVFVAYYARSTVAGFIPDWVVTQLAMSRLEDLMRNLEKRALTWSAKHYVAGHAPVYGGDGEAMPTWPGETGAKPTAELND